MGLSRGRSMRRGSVGSAEALLSPGAGYGGAKFGKTASTVAREDQAAAAAVAAADLKAKAEAEMAARVAEDDSGGNASQQGAGGARKKGKNSGRRGSAVGFGKEEHVGEDGERESFDLGLGPTNATRPGPSELDAAMTEDAAFKPKSVLLLEAMQKVKSPKTRSKEWLLRMVENIYKDKISRDALADAEDNPRLSFPEAMFTFLRYNYGTRALVLEYAATILKTLEAYWREDSRLVTFRRFMSEEWSLRVLSCFLVATQLLRQTSPVECIEYPQELKGKEPWVCTLKGLNLCEVIVGTSCDRNMDAFHHRLLLTAVDATEVEVKSYLNQGPKDAEHAEPRQGRERLRARESSHTLGMKKSGSSGQLQDKNKATSKFKKVVRSTFLLELCEEVDRSERILATTVPDIFRQFEVNGDGSLSLEELVGLVHDCSEGDRDEEDCMLEAEAIMAAAETFEDGLTRDHQVTLAGFTEGVLATSSVRSYVRRHLTDPPAPTIPLDEREQLSMIWAVVIKRHRRSNADVFEEVFRACPAAENVLRYKMSQMDNELDGWKQLQIYISLLNTIWDENSRKLRPWMREALPWEARAERAISRMESAIKVAFGLPYMLDESDQGVGHIASSAKDLEKRKLALQRAPTDTRCLGCKDFVESSRVMERLVHRHHMDAAKTIQRVYWRHRANLLANREIQWARVIEGTGAPPPKESPGGGAPVEGGAPSPLPQGEEGGDGEGRGATPGDGARAVAARALREDAPDVPPSLRRPSSDTNPFHTHEHGEEESG